MQTYIDRCHRLALTRALDIGEASGIRGKVFVLLFLPILFSIWLDQVATYATEYLATTETSLEKDSILFHIHLPYSTSSLSLICQVSIQQLTILLE